MSVGQIGSAQNMLSKLPLLASADAETLDALFAHLRPVSVHAGDVVIREGDSGDQLYLVRSGRLRVLVEQEDGPRIVRELGAGAAIGELSLLTGSLRSAAVEAVRDSELLELEADVFLALLERDSGFAIAVARALAQQLQASGRAAVAEGSSERRIRRLARRGRGGGRVCG